MNNDQSFWPSLSTHFRNSSEFLAMSNTFLNESNDELKAHRRHYYLGPPYEGQYLTRREAECLLLMIHGYTNNQAAKALDLSPRTIEYYLKNIRNKLNCYSKIHLLREIQKTNFLDVIDFELPKTDT